MSWEWDAACKGRPVELFFPCGPVKGRRALVRNVIGCYCVPCPVRTQCLDDELARIASHRWGVRGGVYHADGGGAATRSVYDPHGYLPTTEGEHLT